ncbi:MAG: helix-turn-helix domain-containing protein [Pseudonocardiaceae bacterium]
MARNWQDVRAQARATGKLDDTRIAMLGATLRAETRAHRLAEIRRAYGLDQSDVAERVGVSQSRISRIERGELDRSEISTVRGYVEALGGDIEIVAKFGDERITLA